MARHQQLQQISSSLHGVG